MTESPEEIRRTIAKLEAQAASARMQLEAQSRAPSQELAQLPDEKETPSRPLPPIGDRVTVERVIRRDRSLSFDASDEGQRKRAAELVTAGPYAADVLAVDRDARSILVRVLLAGRGDVEVTISLDAPAGEGGFQLA